MHAKNVFHISFIYEGNIICVSPTKNILKLGKANVEGMKGYTDK